MTLPYRPTADDLARRTPAERQEHDSIIRSLNAYYRREDEWKRKRDLKTLLIWVLWILGAVGLAWLVVHR